VPASVIGMVPKYTPMHIYADVQLGWWERICVLIWGRVVIDTTSMASCPSTALCSPSSAAVPTILGRMGNYALLSGAAGQ